VIFFNFIISVRGGHCYYSPQTPNPSYATAHCPASITFRKFQATFTFRTLTTLTEAVRDSLPCLKNCCDILKSVMFRIQTLRSRYAASSGNRLPTFRDNMSVPSSRVNNNNNKAGSPSTGFSI
jgi:hypothetical protein